MAKRLKQRILSMEDMKYVFNVAVLRPGDILLMNTYEERQRKVMEKNLGSCIYDHAALYIGDAFLMEADGFGVVMNHIYSYVFLSCKDACVLRLKNRSLATINRVIFNAKSFMGMEFSPREAFFVSVNKSTNKTDISNRTFCSRLVSQCYSQEGISFFHNPNYCSPDDFLKSDLLTQIESSLEPYTHEMESAVRNAQNQKENFNTATFWAIPFNQFSLLYKEDVQTMGQLLAVASKHIDQDEQALAIIADNHLFQPMDDRNENWPWISDEKDFFNHFQTTEQQMFFLTCQFLHFDLTYIPSLKQNFASLCVAVNMCPNSKVIARIKQGFSDVLNETINTRKRLAELYLTTANHDKDGFIAFIEKYGFYKDFEYLETPICMDHILHDMLKVALKD